MDPGGQEQMLGAENNTLLLRTLRNIRKLPGLPQTWDPVRTAKARRAVGQGSQEVKAGLANEDGQISPGSLLLAGAIAGECPWSSAPTHAPAPGSLLSY